MYSTKGKVLHTKKTAVGTSDILPQQSFTREKAEWHFPLLQVKSSKTVLTKQEIGKPKRSKRKSRAASVCYLEMLEKRRKFCSDIDKTFKLTNEDDGSVLSAVLTSQEKQWLKYEYYLRKLIPSESVAPLSDMNIKRILNLIPNELKADTETELKRMIGEIQEEYIWIIKKSAVDTLQVTQKSHAHSYHCISKYFQEMLMFLDANASQMQRRKKKLLECYVLSNKCLLRLLDVWLHTCSHLIFVSPDCLKRQNPYVVNEYLQYIKMQVLTVQDTLQKVWYPLLQRIVNNGLKKQHIPDHLKTRIFNCIATVMTSQLKSLLFDSLVQYEECVSYFQKYIGSMKINISFSREGSRYDPDIFVIKKILCEPFDLMQGAVMHYPRIENCLEDKFSETSKNSLKTMLPENVIENFKSRACNSLDSEWQYPLQLLQDLDKYIFLLTEEAGNDLESFLASERSLEDYQGRMDRLITLKQEIEIKRQKHIEAGMFFIDCNEFVEKLYTSVTDLKNKLMVHLQNHLASFTEK